MARSKNPRQDRVDKLLVDRRLARTRTKAQALILAGRVSSAGVRLDKPGRRLPVDAPLDVATGQRYVSRGGHKLAGALRGLELSVSGRDAMDVGASTGGFTQVLLEAGARRVIALDVGRGQLDWNLRNHPQVHVLEGLNARYLDPANLPFRPSLAAIDVSFISLKLVLPPVTACLSRQGELVALVKPQFEVGRGEVGRHGVVRRRERHEEVLHEIADFARGRGWGVRGFAPSALPGAEGNLEFFVHIVPRQSGLGPDRVKQSIRSALRALEEQQP